MEPLAERTPWRHLLMAPMTVPDFWRLEVGRPMRQRGPRRCLALAALQALLQRSEP